MRRGLFFIVFLFLLQAIFSQEQKQLVVVSTEDDVVNPAKGSLRWACMQATEDVSVSITFSFSEIGPKVIKLKDELSINGEVRIDGSSYVDSVIIDGMDVVRNFYLPSSFSKLELNNLKLQGPLCVEASKNSILKIENSDIEQIACIACSCDIDNSVLRGTLNFVSEGIFHVENCKFEDGASVACPGNPSEELILSKNLLLGDYTVSSSYGPLFVTRSFQVSKPHIDTAYVQYGEIFIEGYVDSLEVVDVELFVSKYDTYKAEKYLGAVKTKSDGSFVYRGELDSSLINGETISISATATYDEKLTSEYSSYAIDGHYWIVTNTNSTGEGSLKWACQNATQNDTIIFLFNEPGNKVIKSDGEFVLGASVDGSSFPDSIIIKPGFSLKNRVPVIKDIVIEGNKNNYGIVGGVSTSNVPDLIENCVIRNCSIGVNGAKLIEGCQILNNKIGISSSAHGGFVEKILNCVVSGNDSIGIAGEYHCIENNIIGLSPDQRYAMPNGVGILGNGMYGQLDTVRNNVISGNRYDGIVIDNRTHVRVFEGNLVGTNKYFDLNSDLGNGGSGLVMTEISRVSFFFNNYFVNNKEYGVRNSTNSSLTINSSYFGVDKSANPMPNKLAGIYTDVYSQLDIKNCFISNNGDGIKRENAIGNTSIDSCVFANNIGYGVCINLFDSSLGIEITNSKFSMNGRSAISLDGIKPYSYKFSKNLFENTQSVNITSEAIAYESSFPIPQITSISYAGGIFKIEGKVDTAAKANIELFYSDGELQTANEFLVSDSTSEEGNFLFSISDSDISKVGKIYFSATATYGFNTSKLSDPFTCNTCCFVDTIYKADTIIYGEQFLKEVYAIGRHDSIFETIALPNGCDSVVMHTLVVKPNPEVKEYYVKTSRQGTGDGSSWENAMDGMDFAACLPLAPDGATFYVAEGTYKPVYDAGLYIPENSSSKCYAINSNVTIRGGYPADASGTDVPSEPQKYQTIFDGDILGDDVIDDSLNMENISDDVVNLFEIWTKSASKVSFDGVKVQHASELIRQQSISEVVLTLNNTTLSYGKGLGVYLQSDSKLEAYNSTFDKNAGFNCIYLDGNSLELKNVTFKNNVVNTVINVNNSELTALCDSLNFVSNICSYAIFNTASGFELTNSGLIDNRCYALISINSAESKLLRLYNCEIKDNSLESYYANLSIDVEVENCLVENNQSLSSSPSLSCKNYYGVGNVIKNNSFHGVGVSCDTALVYDSKIFENKTENENLGYLINSQYADLKRDTVENNSLGVFLENCIKGFVIDSIYFANNKGMLCNVDKEIGYETDSVNYYILNSKLLSNFPAERDEYVVSMVRIYSSLSDSLFVYRTEVSNNILNKNSYLLLFVNLNVSLTQSQINGNIIQKENAENGVSLLCIPGSIMEVEQSSIIGNVAGSDIISSAFGTLFMKNSTMALNECGSDLISNYPGTNITLINNTIVGNNAKSETKFPKGIYPVELLGNIIVGNSFDVATPDLCELYKFNITERELAATEISSLLEGVYDDNTALFVPTVKVNGGFTPTVALKSDRLPDGTSIRFPLSETTVTTDQRGVERLEQTCMGAYELECTADTTLATDTIVVGEKFLDELYAIGRHDSIFETIALPNGCDSVVMHTLIVKPDPKVLNYYVKTERQGKGDGSSWENAMDSIDFATYLPLAPDGATFYVAEGVYRPVYDAGLFVPKNSSSKCYAINSNVTIRGGYPADATGTDVPSEPQKYQTIFDGDILGDDVIDESLDEDGFVSIETTNTIDNASQMYLSLVPDEQSVILDGVVVKNTNSYALNILNPNKRVTLLNNSFVYNNGTVVNLPYEGDVVELRNCTFEKNIGNVFNLPNVDTLLMDNVSLVQNATLGFLSHPKKGYASINNSKFSNNGSDIQLIHYDVNISNSEFFSNKGSNVLYIVGDSSVANIRTSKFISNKSTNVVTNYGSSDLIIDSCEFVSNISEGNLIYCPNEKDVFVLTNSEIQNNEVNELIFVQNRKKVWIKNNKIKQNASNILYCNSIQDSIVVECNVISENNSQSIGLYFNGSSDCILYFDKNSVCHNVSSDNLFDFTSSFKNVFIENNTIVSNDVLTVLLEFHGCPVKLYNNTIVGNVSNGVSNCVAGYYDIVGNVILGNSCKLRNGIISRNTEEIRTRWSEVRKIENNILPSIQWIDDGGYCVPIKEYMKNNIVSIYDSSDVCEEFKGIENRNEEILTSLFEGTYNSETNLFTPVLADNGGFTPTVALKSDRLPDGTSIRFPLSETTVTTDQRGVARLEQTCMGAYELECTADTTFATDTIVVGEKFLDEVYAIGRHDSIFETIALPNGCDSVVMHTLIVKPDPKVLNYYVKTERWGAGDGSSWEDAMNGDDFIFMLPQVGDGVTFHVAEGRYMKEGNALSNKINSSVKIIGGYEAEAKTGAVSDPKKYHTVFETLPDKYGYGFSNLCFYELTNTESVVELSNLDLSHSGVRGKAGKLVVDSCSFYDCYLTLDVAVDTLIVSNSYFGKILEEARLYNGINHIRQQGKFASISACTFEGNSSSSLGIRMIDISASGAAHIENCTFANLYNRSTGYQITLASSNDTAFFVNNTVVGNIHQSSFSFTNVAFIGNIIAGSSSSLKDGKILKSEYNLVGEGSSLSNSDKDVNSSDLVEILNGTYDASTGLFTPVLADNGGFTPTVALKSDRLPDGTSIRFPLSETTVATDQRGVERFPLTCKGAYELEYDTSDCEIGTIIFKEDFGGNYLSDPDFGPALPNGLTTLMYGDNLVPYNGYSLRKEALKRNITNCNDFSNVNKHIYCGWYADFDDHTSEGDFNRGYFMQIDMNRNKTVFYTITINDLCEHTHLNLLMWVHPVNSSADSELILSVEDLSGNVLASEAFVVESSVNEWSKISIPFTVPLNQTSIVYKIYSEADSYGGDIAIDDIEVRLCKPAVSVNSPEDYLCASSDYKLTATYGNKGGYIEPVNYTWFKNSEPSYEIEGWTKVSEGKELQLENISSDAYYRCVISSAGVEGVFDKCNSASDIIPVLLGGLNDTSFVADTILTGEIYNGNQYFEVGTFDGIVETIHRDGTCDSIVLHELHVVREDFCSLATLSSNPITKSSDYLQFTSSYPRDLKFTIMDKEGNIVCKTVERTYGAGEHKVSLFKLFGIDKRDFDPLTPYILVVSSGNDLFMTYIYISWM